MQPSSHVSISSLLAIDSEKLLYRYRAGIPWRDLPERFGDWKIVHQRFSRWAKSGVFERIFKQLASDHDNEYMMINATIVRAHQHSAGSVRLKTQPRSSPWRHVAEEPVAVAAAQDGSARTCPDIADAFPADEQNNRTVHECSRGRLSWRPHHILGLSVFASRT
jgi:transposase